MQREKEEVEKEKRRVEREKVAEQKRLVREAEEAEKAKLMAARVEVEQEVRAKFAAEERKRKEKRVARDAAQVWYCRVFDHVKASNSQCLHLHSSVVSSRFLTRTYQTLKAKAEAKWEAECKAKAAKDKEEESRLSAIQQEREALLREKKRKDAEATKTYDSASLWGAQGSGGSGGGSKRRRGPAEDATVKVRLPTHWSTDTFWSQMRNTGDENGDKVSFG